MRNEQNHQNMVKQIATILAYVKRSDKKLETIIEDNVFSIGKKDNNLVCFQ